MDESDRSNDTLKAEGLAAQLYVKSREGAPYVWWHLLREDMKRKFRSAAKKKNRSRISTPKTTSRQHPKRTERKMPKHSIPATKIAKLAAAAGLTVRDEAGRTRIDRVGRGAVGVVITDSGSIYRSDVALEVATRLTPSRAMKILGI